MWGVGGVWHIPLNPAMYKDAHTETLKTRTLLHFGITCKKTKILECFQIMYRKKSITSIVRDALFIWHTYNKLSKQQW